MNMFTYFGATHARTAGVACALLAALVTVPASASDIDVGKGKAQSCAMCHGANGISQMPGAPNLAGQSAIYVVEQLKHFRNGSRSNEIMNVIAKPLSDTDISELAAWYESLKIVVQAP